MRRLWFLMCFGALALAHVAAPALARRRPAPTPAPSPTATPVPTPSPTPTLSPQQRLERLQAQVETIAREAPGRLGVAVEDVSTGARAAVRGDEAFPLAGCARLAVALAVFRRADQHRLELDQRVLVTAADLRHGPGPLASAHPRGNVTPTYWQLTAALLEDGDATANDVLLENLGGPAAVQTFLTNLGTRGFRFRLSEADRYAAERAHRSFARGGDNAGTPDGVADLLADFVQEHYLHQDATAEMLLLLGNAGAARAGAGNPGAGNPGAGSAGAGNAGAGSAGAGNAGAGNAGAGNAGAGNAGAGNAVTDNAGTDNAGFRAGLPPEVELAHATGEGPAFDGVTEATNDAGIATLSGGRRVVLVALLAGARGDEAARETVLARVARAAYDAFGP